MAQMLTENFEVDGIPETSQIIPENVEIIPENVNIVPENVEILPDTVLIKSENEWLNLKAEILRWQNWIIWQNVNMLK